ncbi:hypothetical protein DAPPUDRAFT_108443 [Daphnia pulex]|uniref:Uncharacterized protein n=1 Tax=Daphnia pulex TaxID=6669 RepID=E9H081_DAPPU|nr:hypothetical protein DAPPUDRAFT_108443 [Daphnia pulex]|eukprot:EFX74858.1 hypothetical protein DAPPUDRAFT_108443 [Daphnia pulex]
MTTHSFLSEAVVFLSGLDEISIMDSLQEEVALMPEGTTLTGDWIFQKGLSHLLPFLFSALVMSLIDEVNLWPSSVSFWRVWGKPRKRQLRWIGFPHEGQPTVAYYDRGIEQVNKKEASETEEYDLVYLHFRRQCPTRMGRFLSLGLVKRSKRLEEISKRLEFLQK